MRLRLLSAFTPSKLTQISLGLICTFLVLFADVLNDPVIDLFLNRLNSVIYDRMIGLHMRPYKELARVVIIDIDDVSINKEGRWPWPRDKLALLLNKLQEAGVVVAGLDIVMSDPEINYALGLKNKLDAMPPELEGEHSELPGMLEDIAPQVDNDLTLSLAMKDYDVVLGFLFQNLESLKKGLLPPALTNQAGESLNVDLFNARCFGGYSASLNLFMEAAGHGGFVTNLPDADGIIRQGLILACHDKKLYASLALMTAMRYLLAEHVELKIRQEIDGPTLYGIEISGTFIPTNGQGQILIPFWGPPFTLPYYSATDILQDKVSAAELEGAVAIVGSSTVMLGDLHPSPVARVFPGVEMVGNMVAAMLGQQVATKFDWITLPGIIGLTVIGSLFALLFPFLEVMGLVITTISMTILILAGVCTFFFFKNLYIPSAFVLTLMYLQAMINYAYKFFLEKRQKYKIKQLFGQYVPESYVKELIETPDVISMEGQTLDMTVLFSDIRSFTTTSEGLDAAGVKRLLNTFFTPMTEIIFNNQGTIDKYVGDMVVAFWGAPLPIENHAYYAIKTALEVFEALPDINQTMSQNGLPSVNVGIGLGTGLMNVGDMGSKFRRAYTVLGDVVNLASRLESLTKFYGANILVNDATHLGQDAFIWRVIDKVAVKGRAASLTIYEPLGFAEKATTERLAELEQYHQALDAYFAMDWTKAEQLFQTLLTSYPTSHLYELYCSRIVAYKKSPPPKDWDGVFIHKEK